MAMQKLCVRSMRGKWRTQVQALSSFMAEIDEKNGTGEKWNLNELREEWGMCAGQSRTKRPCLSLTSLWGRTEPGLLDAG